MQITKESVLKALRAVIIDSDGGNIVDKNRVSALVIRGSKVGFVLTIEPKMKLNHQQVIGECKKILKTITGVKEVLVVLTAESAIAEKTVKEAPVTCNTKDITSRPKKQLPGIKNIVVVASGKGGVGKSTLSVNLAVTLAQIGYKVGLMDADIYGPSVPHMLGIDKLPVVENGLIVPHLAYGIKSISIGYLVNSETATVWRGPMVTKALYKLLDNVKWGELDILVIDTPPGTGDVHLSLAENYLVSGGIIVSTPQELALIDARKALNMFNKLDIPILGMVENMSYFSDPLTGNKYNLFGESGVSKMALNQNIKFLGEIPIYQQIRKSSDDGVPITSQNIPDNMYWYYKNIAENLLISLGLKC